LLEADLPLPSPLADSAYSVSVSVSVCGMLGADPPGPFPTVATRRGGGLAERRGEGEEQWMRRQHHDKMASVYKDRRL
jgi:hypothetical protein